jgi:glucan phosphoethanolaminetransferase (alkaline phosphatase superfamily)
MELDDLKKSWQLSAINMKRPQKDISEILKSRSEQPLAKLKRRFLKGIILMPLIAAFVFIEFSPKHSFGSRFLASYLIVFSLIMMAYFYVNYRLVSKMQTNDGDLHTNLLVQTGTLKRLLELRLLLMRFAIAFFFVSIEVIMYARDGHGYESWYAHAAIFRLSVYLAIFVIFFFFTRRAMNHRYRKYIQHLELLLKEFHDV